MPVVSTDRSVVLVGPVRTSHAVFDRVFKPGRKVVAADGGAARALEFGVVPDAVIGDMDSFQHDRRIAGECIHHVADQDSTDFEKCLGLIEAPRIYAIGFLGDRIDHSLAVMSALVQSEPGKCVLISEHDVVVHCPPELEIDLGLRARVSLFPMASLTGKSKGLNWPIDGLEFQPNGQIGTSNHTTGRLTLTLSGPGMLLILEPEALDPLRSALAD